MHLQMKLNKTSLLLSYSCGNWEHHLSATKSIPHDPLYKTLTEFLQLYTVVTKGGQYDCPTDS